MSLGDERFRTVLAVLMVVVTLLTLVVKPKPLAAGEDGHRESFERVMGGGGHWRFTAAFFGVGIYGGFVQAGVGFFILAVLSWFGLDLVSGNALKVATVLCFTVLALGLFAWQGHVDWGLGLALAMGTMIGGSLGVRLTVLKGHRFVKQVVVVMILVFAVRLLMP